VLANHECVGDFAVGLARGDEAQDLDFSRRQPGLRWTSSRLGLVLS
jgi:hypothetical protein